MEPTSFAPKIVFSGHSFLAREKRKWQTLLHVFPKEVILGELVEV